jgi:rRNA maturation endonuclease Nob1
MTSEPGQKKSRMARCEQCATQTETAQLFEVRDRKICAACGEAAIKEWNSFVHEAEHP